MSKYKEYQEQVAAELQSATELLVQTFPLSHDPKVLVSVLHHIRSAQQQVVSFLATINGRQDSFRALVKTNVDEEGIQAFETVEELYHSHQTSDVEFARNKDYILADESYRLKALKAEQLKAYLRQTIRIAEQLLR